MPKDERYRLSPLQIPVFPDCPRWEDQLRWCVAIIDPGSKDLGIAASLLSYFLKHERMTLKQAKFAQAVINRTRAQFEADDLVFQSFGEPSPTKSDTLSETLATMIPRGRA